MWEGINEPSRKFSYDVFLYPYDVIFCLTVWITMHYGNLFNRSMYNNFIII